MTAKVPTLTTALVRSEIAARGWVDAPHHDEDAMHFRRGKQRLTVTLASLRSSRFQMRNFNKELDLLDKGRA